ncbi:HepT-like ribonuclease domain-containing protein [Paramicrobacterium chengjingii]|uniref:DUF86 domain-containing protein n=1 Tax=Paramicrobacterium chengjingii TaxID=2769067 RepID=A0ABX6YIY2_9MICO|nr:HepT-like ribonuclease domain-containing protein [Microbacterium chengjingii]QPZ38712.1 DUF86 domain-containing protein [Microbacterium chengjingii]
MTRNDHELVCDALDHLAVLHQHLERSDLDDQTVADAVSLRLASAIEAISETSERFRDRTFGDDWKIIWATRNRISHGYAYIDMGLIRATVIHDLPDFERGLRESLAE